MGQVNPNTIILNKYDHIHKDSFKADDIDREIMSIKALVAIANELSMVVVKLDEIGNLIEDANKHK